MSFSDEDLKRLKQACQYERPTISGKEILALLERLAAAEKVCELIALNTGWKDHAVVEAWKKSAGRG